MNLQQHIKKILKEEISEGTDFKIKSIKAIDGKNKWSESKTKLIHMVLYIGKYEQKPSNKIPKFYERIKKYIPSLKTHRCSEGKPGGFLNRIKEGTWMGHIIEHVALELQTLAGMDTGWGRTRMVKGEEGVYNVVFNYTNKECGKMAAKEAVNVVKDIIEGNDPQIDKIIKKLKSKNIQESIIRKVLKEETDKKDRGLLNVIKNVGLYQFLEDTGISYAEVFSKIGDPPREVKIQYLKDLIEDRAEDDLFDITFFTGAIPLWSDYLSNLQGYVEFLSNYDNILRVHVSIWNMDDDEIAEDYEKISEDDISDDDLDLIVNELTQSIYYSKRH